MWRGKSRWRTCRWRHPRVNSSAKASRTCPLSVYASNSIGLAHLSTSLFAKHLMIRQSRPPGDPSGQVDKPTAHGYNLWGEVKRMHRWVIPAALACTAILFPHLSPGCACESAHLSPFCNQFYAVRIFHHSRPRCSGDHLAQGAQRLASALCTFLRHPCPMPPSSVSEARTLETFKLPVRPTQ